MEDLRSYDEGVNDTIEILMPFIDENYNSMICPEVIKNNHDYCKYNCKGLTPDCVKKYIHTITHE